MSERFLDTARDHWLNLGEQEAVMPAPKALTVKDFADRLQMSVKMLLATAREGRIPEPINPSAQPSKWVWTEAVVNLFITGEYGGPTAVAPSARRETPAAAAKRKAKQKRDGVANQFMLPADLMLEQMADGTVKIVGVNPRGGNKS